MHCPDQPGNHKPKNLKVLAYKAKSRAGETVFQLFSVTTGLMAAGKDMFAGLCESLARKMLLLGIGKSFSLLPTRQWTRP
jgi:hypothetical protein